jgi:anaerobic magnesium-protoporphyrin IX monomethyl ester cyclase
MKVLFLHPYGSNFFKGVNDITTIFNLMPPLGILSIAAWLEKHGIDVEIIDGYASRESHEIMVAKIISCTTSSFPETNRIATLLKNKAPNIVTVLGGAHSCTIGAPLLDSYPALDYLVIGEGENTMLDLARSGFSNVDKIPGVAYRAADGKGTLSSQRKLIKDLDSLPFPAYHLLPNFPRIYKLPLFSYPKAPNTSIISSRGCPYACSYCDRSVFSSGFRFNSPEYILEHVAMLNRDYGIRHVFFYDDLFTFDRRRVAEFCELKAKKGIKVSYNCIARLEHVDAELLALLKSSGCWQVNFGIESGDPEVLKKHRKFYGLDEVGQKLMMVRKAGMRVKGLFMVGLPGEDEATIRRTIDYALSLPLDEINVTKFTPFPGAPVYRNIREFGEFEENWELMNCINTVFVPTGMTREQVDGLYDEFISRFYHRPHINLGYAKMLWKSPHSVYSFLSHLPQLVAFEMKQKW